MALLGCGSDVTPPPTPPTPADPAPITTTWYLNADSSRLTLTISTLKDHPLQATLVKEASGEPSVIDAILWDGLRLEFRRRFGSTTEWYSVIMGAGIFVGRFSQSEGSMERPADPTQYRKHVTAWSELATSGDILPRGFELLLDGQQRARLHLDRDSQGAFVGRMKVYSSVSNGSAAEQLADDLMVTEWNGTHLAFSRINRSGNNAAETYQGTLSGRLLAGTFTTSADSAKHSFTGARADVLMYGIVPRTATDLQTWQTRTRSQLHSLMLAGNPAPTSATVTQDPPMSPQPMTQPAPDRDDDLSHHPQDYLVRKLTFRHTLPSPSGGPDLTRTAYGYLALPTGPPPPGGFPAAVTVNGHDGSAWVQLDPDEEYYWYGDAFARRGYAVVALDISHRPLLDRQTLYTDYTDGDDAAHGNVTHPAIQAPGRDSDWEEDGERVWDVMRAVDFLSSLPEVNPKRIVATGLSMGGEITTFSAALEPRIALAVAAGFSPDLGVMLYHGNHPCWRWQHADVREYIEVADLHALIAPRPLVIETGKQDWVFSNLPEPFAASKQLFRWSSRAYGQPNNFVHYLHYDGHHYHVGDLFSAGGAKLFVRVPVLSEPDSPYTDAWETDGRTRLPNDQQFTLFDFTNSALP